MKKAFAKSLPEYDASFELDAKKIIALMKRHRILYPKSANKEGVAVPRGKKNTRRGSKR